jgi:hypothetical protein
MKTIDPLKKSTVQKELSIDILKKITVETKELSEAMSYFFDIMESPTSNKGDLYTGSFDLYRAILTPVLKNQFKDQVVEIVAFYLMQIKENNFVHGMVILSNNVSLSLYFFDDIYTGLAMFASASGYCNYYRITGFTAKDIKDPKNVMPIFYNRTEH